MVASWLATCLALSTVAQVPGELSREQSQRAALALVLIPLIGALLSFGLLRYYGQLVRKRPIDEGRLARVIVLIVLAAFVVLTAAFFVAAALVR